ncbi:MAG: baseplate J/gp47 family protein, partial [Dehalococcoidia bacterium]|nr:baseplate J/gp47 family protein [Dehalococcoidia bacterium]
PGSARGEVTFLNRSPARLVIPASTLLAAGQSVQFKTLDQAEVPPSGGTARTRVIASSPGTTGNVGSMAIDHVVDESYASALAVWNEIPTSGGVEEETMTVTAQDQSNLRSRLRGKLVKDGQAQLQALKSESESIYPITVSFSPMEETFDKAIGAEASSLTLRIKGSVSGLAFDGKDVNTLAQKALEAQVAPGFRLLPTTLAVAPLEAYDWGEGWVAFRALAKAKASVMIEGDKLAESLRGKNPKEAQEYLNGRFPQHEQLTIQVKPIWLDWIPVYFWKIEVRY